MIDSIAALDSIEAIDAKMADSKAEMGNRAKQIYKMFRIRNELFYRLGVTMVCINQLRSKLGAGFGQDTSTTPGGTPRLLSFVIQSKVVLTCWLTI